MRNDLTADFLAKMANDYRKPIQVAVFHFQNLGDILLSDRDIVIGGKLYKGLIEEWGELSSVGNENSESGTMQMTLSIWNGGEEPFSTNFFFENPTDVFVDVYQTFDGLQESDLAIIGHFVAQDPIEYSESSQLVQIDLVTTNMRYFGQVGELLTLNNYPYALVSDVNKSIDLIVGNCGQVKALCSSSPPRATQSGSILKKTGTTLNVQEDSLDDLGFLQAGYLQIDAEILRYNSRTKKSFYITERGVDGTIATDHSDGMVIIQAKKDIEYIVGLGPIASITDVRVKGQIPKESYDVYPNENPAKIVFHRQPTYIEYSKGARNIEVDFDAVSPNNKAYQPHYSYDRNFRSFGALINKTHSPLAVLQFTPALDDGEVVRAFLAVEHWATDVYNNDRVDVWVDGIGVVGSLARPNPADVAQFKAEVDIDHEHDHVAGGNHDHGFVNPSISNNDLTHGHPESSVSGGTFEDGGNVGLPYVIYCYDQDHWLQLGYAGYSGIIRQSVRIKFRKVGVGQVHLRGGGSIYSGNIMTWAENDMTVDQSIQLYPNTGKAYSQLTLYIRPGGVVGGNITITEMTLITEIAGSIKYGTSNNRAVLAANAIVNKQLVDATGIAIKSKDDVDPLLTANRQLENIVTKSSIRSVVQKFDLTDFLTNISWQWLTNKEVQLRYTGTVDTVDVVVTYIYFDVEYRQKRVTATDEVTATVSGLIENRPDSVIQYLLTEKANVPLGDLSSVFKEIPKWDDDITWNDLTVWVDEGQVSGDVPLGAAFQEAAKWFHYNNYTIDGVISGSLSVKDAIKKITWQTRSRLIWQNGKAKLAVDMISDSWQFAKDIPISDIQLKSFSAKLSGIDRLYNAIDIFYSFDRITNVKGTDSYNSTASRRDLLSIDKHGERRQDDLFMFDLVRNQAMAESIADYYIWFYGESTTIYSLISYLKHFDLEKSDYVTISSYRFDRIKKLPVVIKEIIRSFGSGKTKRINTFNLLCESIRQVMLNSHQEDIVEVTDALKIIFGFIFHFDDVVNVTDDLLIIGGKGFESEVFITDIFESEIWFKPSLLETVLAVSELTMNLTLALNSSLKVSDDVQVSDEKGFGAMGFGAPDGFGVKFGSKTLKGQGQDEVLSLEDILESNFSKAMSETVTANDNLLFSDGFGGTALGSGFGLSPFGK